MTDRRIRPTQNRPWPSAALATAALAGLVSISLLLACRQPPEPPVAGRTRVQTTPAAPVPASTAAAAPDAIAQRHTNNAPSPQAVFRAKHDAQRHSLSNSPIVEVALAKGGRSVAFKLTLKDGTKALYKPEQTFAAHFYSELACYYLDRVLGLKRVPPAIGRVVPWSELTESGNESPHVEEVVVQKDGSVRGAMILWLSGNLVPLSPPPGWEAWLRVEPLKTTSPFQRVREYQRARRAARSQTAPGGSAPTGVPPSRIGGRAAELSDLVLFDYLTANHDRWGGDFTNVRTLEADGPLIALDNANGFPPALETRNQQSAAKLQAVQRFQRSTVQAIERLRLRDLKAALDRDPLAPLLTPEQLAAFEERRKHTLAHIRTMRQKFGDSAVLW